MSDLLHVIGQGFQGVRSDAETALKRAKQITAAGMKVGKVAYQNAKGRLEQKASQAQSIIGELMK